VSEDTQLDVRRQGPLLHLENWRVTKLAMQCVLEGATVLLPGDSRISWEVRVQRAGEYPDQFLLHLAPQIRHGPRRSDRHAASSELRRDQTDQTISAMHATCTAAKK
jgi:hypothetical protein